MEDLFAGMIEKETNVEATLVSVAQLHMNTPLTPLHLRAKT